MIYLDCLTYADDIHIPLKGNLYGTCRVTIKREFSIKQSYNINSFVIGYHLVQFNLIALSIFYEPVKAVCPDSLWALAE